MRTPDFGVCVPTTVTKSRATPDTRSLAELDKPKKPGFVGHNISEGEIDSPSVTNRRKRSTIMHNSTVSNTVSNSTTTANADEGSEAPVSELQVVSLKEILENGIKVSSEPATWKGRAISAATTGAGVAVGIGVAAGLYALGSLVAGMFGSDVEIPPTE